ERAPGTWDSIRVKARTRGNFRLRTCYFPPLRIKIKEKDAAHTLFAGNKSLKLVLPCYRSGDMNQLILKEYLVYQLYQQVTPYYFQTRLVNIDLTELSRKKPQSYKLLGFFIEDDAHVAERKGATVMKEKKLRPGAYDALLTARHDFFQYMIGNTDFSTTYEHNNNSIFVKPNKFIPLAYDFDMSGFVNAPYAQANAPTLGTGNIRERVYRGFCRDENTMQTVRQEYLKLEPMFYATIDRYASEFREYDVKDMKDYLGEFFNILKDDGEFRSHILQGCRKD
ncbi:MAG TPA: hypothetical protein VG737_17905, partial [Cyclobacteriaceae bacterium]|nr:hypothetical protein [Cyclobacteriaceae bacterium]